MIPYVSNIQIVEMYMHRTISSIIRINTRSRPAAYDTQQVKLAETKCGRGVEWQVRNVYVVAVVVPFSLLITFTVVAVVGRPFALLIEESIMDAWYMQVKTMKEIDGASYRNSCLRDHFLSIVIYLICVIFINGRHMCYKRRGGEDTFLIAW
jgi:hypothetical protein